MSNKIGGNPGVKSKIQNKQIKIKKKLEASDIPTDILDKHSLTYIHLQSDFTKQLLNDETIIPNTQMNNSSGEYRFNQGIKNSAHEIISIINREIYSNINILKIFINFLSLYNEVIDISNLEQQPSYKQYQTMPQYYETKKNFINKFFDKTYNVFKVHDESITCLKYTDRRRYSDIINSNNLLYTQHNLKMNQDFFNFVSLWNTLGEASFIHHFNAFEPTVMNIVKNCYKHLFKLYLKGGVAQRYLCYYINKIFKNKTRENVFTKDELDMELGKFSDFDLNFVINYTLKPLDPNNNLYPAEVCGFQDFWQDFFNQINSIVKNTFNKISSGEYQLTINKIIKRDEFKSRYLYDIFQVIKKTNTWLTSDKDDDGKPKGVFKPLNDFALTNLVKNEKGDNYQLIHDRTLLGLQNFNNLSEPIWNDEISKSFNINIHSIRTKIAEFYLNRIFFVVGIFSGKENYTFEFGYGDQKNEVIPLDRFEFIGELVDISVLDYFVMKNNKVITENRMPKINSELINDWEHCVKSFELNLHSCSDDECYIDKDKSTFNTYNVYVYDMDMMIEDLEITLKETIERGETAKVSKREKRVKFIKKYRCYYKSIIDVHSDINPINKLVPSYCMDLISSMSEYAYINNSISESIWNLTLNSGFLIKHTEEQFVLGLIINFLDIESKKIEFDPNYINPLIIKTREYIQIIYSIKPNKVSEYYKVINEVFLSLIASYYHLLDSINDNFIRSYAFIIFMVSIYRYTKALVILNIHGKDYEVPLHLRSRSVASEFETDVLKKMLYQSKEIIVPIIKVFSPIFLAYYQLICNKYKDGASNLYLTIRGGLAVHLLINGLVDKNTNWITHDYLNNNTSISHIPNKFYLDTFNGIDKIVESFKNVRTNDLDLELYYNPQITSLFEVMKFIDELFDLLNTATLDINPVFGFIQKLNLVEALKVLSNIDKNLNITNIRLEKTPPYEINGDILYQILLKYDMRDNSAGEIFQDSTLYSNGYIPVTHHIFELVLKPTYNIQPTYTQTLKKFYEFDKIEPISPGVIITNISVPLFIPHLMVHSRDRIIRDYQDLVSKEDKAWYRAHKYLRRIAALVSSYPAVSDKLIDISGKINLGHILSSLNSEFKDIA